ncbi:Cathepsin B [Papilio machaon]|uniref:Cathepsin B n=1 Tax=Papilio machaon TaxID=76193 RepID=A0A194R0D7_PAPMA|nr:Cathepsin B [Papilio machaon]
MQYLAILFGLLHAVASFDKDIDLKYKTLPEADFIEYFNNLGLSWKITSKKFSDVSQLACSFLNSSFIKDIPYIKHEKDVDLPSDFDARKKWPECPTIGKIYDQELCGSCWTFGVATTASDRTCIHGKGIVNLSEQDFQCCQESHPGNVCQGGYPSVAFNCWTTIGLVTQQCQPYNILELMENKCERKCHNDADYESDKHFGANVYRIQKVDKAIKTELFENGPVEMSFDVYEDFLQYQNGIYEHKFGRLKGGHSVRVIGYGEENGVKYWLAANSWGDLWGEDGFFRIKRFQEEVYFEDEVLTGIPQN